ncbi:MAG TPA: 6-pyruvoyl-tetrahydropterin synthase-related protein, partial [Anaerolineae bacterium]
MRHSIRWFVLAALTCLAAYPLWSTADFWSSYDGLLHLYRAFALDQTLRQGVVYPRWVLDLAYGYGYPIFNFYPPLAAYISETLHLLGLGFPEAIKGTFIAIIAVAVVGAYRMGLEFFHDEPNSELAGLLTATAYVFFPYFFVDVYVRGAVAEALAAALLPWLVLSVHRTLVRQTTGSIVLAALFLALVIFSHSLTAVIVAPFLAAQVLFETLRLPPSRRIQAIARTGVATLTGLGLVAFYWAPFVLELPLVRMGRGIDVIVEVFQTNFLAPSALVQSSWVFSYGAVPVALGLAASLFGVGTLVMTILTRWAQSARSARGVVLFFGAIAVAGALAMTEPARAVWLAFPASTLIQSVWRVSVLIDLGLAVVIGSIPILFQAAIQSSLALRDKSASRVVRIFLTTSVALVLIIAAMAGLSPEALPLPS